APHHALPEAPAPQPRVGHGPLRVLRGPRGDRARDLRPRHPLRGPRRPARRVRGEPVDRPGPQPHRPPPGGVRRRRGEPRRGLLQHHRVARQARLLRRRDPPRRRPEHPPRPERGLGLMRRRPTIAALTVATALVLGACAPSAPDDGADESGTDEATDGAAVSGGTLTIATTTDVVNFNPLIGNSRTDSWVTSLMYPRMLHINADGVKEPALAVDWGWVDETTGYRALREDVTWSDGEPVTAEGVAFTLNATKEDQPSGTLVGQLGYFDHAEAVSDTRVEVHLTEPDSSFVEGVGFWATI